MESVQMNIYQSNTYRKNLSWLHFDDEPRFQERQQIKEQQPYISVFAAYRTIFQKATRSNSPVMATVFHVWPYGRLIEIQSNLRRMKPHRTNQCSNFLGDSFTNRDHVRTPFQFTRESLPQHLKHLKRWFFLKNRPIHFHINITNATRAVKQNYLSFPRIEMKKPLPAPVHCVS